MKCLKCNAERNLKDLQCPQCGVFYAKVEQYLEKQKLEMEQKRAEEKRQQELSESALEKQRLDEEGKTAAEQHQMETEIPIDEKIIRNTKLSYAYLGLFFLMLLSEGLSLTAVIMFIIWILWSYPQKKRVTGTWLASHFKWKMMTVFISLLLALAVTGILHIFPIKSNAGMSLFAIIFGFSVWIWTTYRILKGWSCLSQGKEVPPYINTEDLIKKKTAKIAELYCTQLVSFIALALIAAQYLYLPISFGKLCGLIVFVNLYYGFIIKYNGIKDTWLMSHSKWQGKTFGFSLLWAGIGYAVSGIIHNSLLNIFMSYMSSSYYLPPFNIILLCISLWGIYRSIKGWTSLNNVTELV